jgi:alpha-beta hydrolase superfamily lysophospholipase
MRRLATRLADAGYRVANIDYPSRVHDIDELSSLVGEQLEALAATNGGKLHFVTHSMGGIVIRAYLKAQRPATLGRVVMLSPPSAGSELVDSWGDAWWFRTMFGPAARELGTGDDSKPNRLGPADFEVGVIMGSRSLNPVGSWMIPGPDDGTVSIARARLEGMSDFLVVPCSHTFIMQDRGVAAQVLHFLEHGRFAAE